MPDVRMPDGTVIRNVPAGTTKAQLEARWRSAQPKQDDSRLRGLALGALRPLDNLATWATQTAPFQALDRLGQRMGLPSTESAVRGNDAARSRNTRTGYQTLGTIAGTLPTAYLPGGVLVQGGTAGALSADKPLDPVNVAVNATVGAVAGKVGQKVIAPVAERVGRTKVARQASQALISNLNRARDALPARVRPGPLKMLPNPQMTVADRAVGKTAPDVAALRRNLEDAARLKLPYALADADPRLRMIAGSAGRKAPEARKLAEETLIPRSLGQADRAVNAIDEHLAPVTNIEQRAGDIRQQARSASQPLYDEAFAQPAPISDDLAGILRRPAGKSALQNAYRIAQNEGKDPASLGFIVDDQGGVSLGDIVSNEAGRLSKMRPPNAQNELSRQTVRGWNGSEVRKVGPIDMVGYLRLQGGLKNQGTELSHMGLTNAPRKGVEFAGQEHRFGPLVNDAGMNLDDAAQRAWEAGYFPEHTSRPSVNEFLDALRGTHEGWDRRFLPDDLPEIERYTAAITDRNGMRDVPHFIDKSTPAGPRPFTPDDAYSVTQVESPTMETLDLVKRGLDGELNKYRNQFTGKLDLEGNPEAQSINSLLQSFKAQVDDASPTYAQARASYAENIAPRSALFSGQKLAGSNVPQRQFDAAMSGMSERSIPEAQRGYATAMADQVAKQRFSTNPYNSVYGSPLQQGKVGALFPEGSPAFDRQYQLEKDMAGTAQEVLGGSPTASRLAADQHFEGNGFGDMALDTLGNGGIPTPGTAIKLGTRLLTKVRDAKMSQSRGEAIMPTLLDTDPLAALKFVDDFTRKQAEAEARRRAYEKLFTPIGVATVAVGNGLGPH